MKFLIDDANIERIRELYKYYPIDGVTTNPSILYKCGRPPYEALRDIREFIGNKAELHVQVVSTTAEEMVKEAGWRPYKDIEIVFTGVRPGEKLEEELGLECGVRIEGTKIFACEGGVDG